MDIYAYEKKNGFNLPEIYIDFYYACKSNLPSGLVGTSLIDSDFDLKEGAIALLEEDEVENFLDDKDFVFMMHQGYIFWYFKADGNSNPEVFGYYETDRKPKSLGSLKSFLSEYFR